MADETLFTAARRENCACGESDDCDECASVSEIEARVAEIEASAALTQGSER